jgi:hypothetical protein
LYKDHKNDNLNPTEPFDRVMFNNAECFISGRRSRGCFVLCQLNNRKEKAEVVYKKISLLEKVKTVMVERRPLPLHN